MADRMDLLSGGQRQAVSLVMATLAGSEVLLLDEHTAALDPGMAEFVMGLTDKIVSERKLTTLMVTHSMQQAVSLGDRLIMMHRGNILHDLSGAEKRRLRPNDLLERFEEVRVPHKGGIQEQIIEGVYTVAEDFPRLIDATETMKETRLSQAEQTVLAEASLVARYAEEESPVRPDQIIQPRRCEDAGQSLWQTFNVIQENLTRGGITGRRLTYKELTRNGAIASAA